MGAIAYALSFSPWITYGAVSASLTWRAGVYAALIVQVALAASLSRRRELDALSVGTLAFFGDERGCPRLPARRNPPLDRGAVGRRARRYRARLARSRSLAIVLLRDDTAAIIGANAVALLGAGYVTHRSVKRAEARAAAAGLMTSS